MMPEANPVLTFIVPVRHQDNAADWGQLKRNLSQTLTSLAAQEDRGWRGVVVANEGADLPDMPVGFQVERVSFPPNRLHAMGSASREQVLDSFRLDKGRRVLAGMLATVAPSYFMIVDDDDCVSNRLVGFVRANAGPIGWKITRGYVWNDGTGLLYKHDDFNHICGSSLIIRDDVYNLPVSLAHADIEVVKQLMGSHRGVDRLLSERGTPLDPCPFRAAIYRVGHSGSHSQTPGIFRKYILARSRVRQPLGMIRKISRIRYRTPSIAREFFGV